MKSIFPLIPLPLAFAVAFACTAGTPSRNGDFSGDGPGPTIDIGDGDGGDGDFQIPEGNGNGPHLAEVLTPECSADCTGFSDATDPNTPLVVTIGSVSAEQKSGLDAGGTADGFCVAEPANGTIFPANWTRPRFHAPGVVGPAKITLSTSKMRHSFSLYTESMPALLPREVWEALWKNVHDEDVTYTIVSGGKQATGTFQITPVPARGSMVFWGSQGTLPGPRNNALYGFSVGEDGVIQALAPGDLKGVAIQDNANLREEYTDTAGQAVCVGCHASTPDGAAVAFMDHWEWNLHVASIEQQSAGAAPDFLTAAGAALLSMTWLGTPTFSAGDWQSGARRMVTSWSSRDISADPGSAWKTHDGSVPQDASPIWRSELLWMNLASSATVPVDLRTATPSTYQNEGQSLQQAVAALRGTDWEEIPRQGDENHAVMPDFSHDGRKIVYISTDAPQDGRVGAANEVDLYEVPFAEGQGGAATPVDGASSPDFFEYYPDYSPGDRLIAFNRVRKFDTGSDKQDAYNHVYYRPDSEIYVVPAAGGEATRLASNDPVCEGTAGTLYNSWAKWAPSSGSHNGRSYYFLIFSTARNSPFAIDRGSQRQSPASQLYMTTIIVEADGSITSSPAIYLWNQRNLVSGSGEDAQVSELLTNNVTPAWDQFLIPRVPEVEIR